MIGEKRTEGAIIFLLIAYEIKYTCSAKGSNDFQEKAAGVQKCLPAVGLCLAARMS